LAGRLLCFYDQLELGDRKKADEHLRRSGELGEGIRQPFHITNHLVYRAMRAIMEGRYADGERLAIDALKAGQRVRRDSAEGLFSMQMFAIRRDQGRLGELAGVLKAFVRDKPVSAAWKPGLALLYSKLDMADQAAAEFESLATDNFRVIARDALWSTCLAYLSEVAVYLDDREKADVLYRYLEPYEGRNLVAGASVVFLGAASYYRGLLAHCAGQLERARNCFEDAIELNERMGARPWLARSRYRLARVLLDQDRTGNAAKAVRLDKAAGQTANELGMRRLAQAITR